MGQFCSKICFYICCCFTRNKKSTKLEDKSVIIDKFNWRAIYRHPYNQFSEITDNLYLTGVGGITEQNLKQNNIKFIINVTKELHKYNDPSIESMRIDAKDSEKEDFIFDFDKICDKIHDKCEQNINTLVHCVGGVSRSATVVIAYLMKYKEMTLIEAFKYVKERRSVIRPNNKFFEQLLEFEYKLFGKKTSKMIDIKVNEGSVKIPDFIQRYPDLIDYRTDVSEFEANFANL